MPRKKIISKKTFYASYKETNDNIINSDELTHKELVDMAGGSISNLPVVSKYFSKWMTEQNSRNIFIGKDYIKPAEEYSTDDISLEKASELIGSDAELFLNEEANKLLDPKLSNDIASDYFETSSNADNFDTKFIDCSIVENVTNKMLKANKDDIIKESINEIKKYHDDQSYETKVDIEKIIDISQKMILEYKEKKLLK